MPLKQSKRLKMIVGNAASRLLTRDSEPVTVMQFRIALKALAPAAWRMVQVLSTTTLNEFHGVVQVSMGWDSIHLYHFRLGAKRYGSWETGATSPAVMLGDLDLSEGSRFLYEYDMLKRWELEITLEARNPVNPRGRYPVCIGGAGACPPDAPGPQLNNGATSGSHQRVH
jgi:hypothetical protein